MIPRVNKNIPNYFCDTERYKCPTIRPVVQSIINEYKLEADINHDFALQQSSKVTNPADTDEIAIAEELKEIKREKLLDEKRRQQLRLYSTELRSLEKTFKMAYAKKALSYQKAEREAISIREKKLQYEENQLIEKSKRQKEENEKKRALEERTKNQEYREFLTHQINEKQRKSKNYQEFLEEKKIIENLVDRIDKQQKADLLEKHESRIIYRQEMDNYSKMKEVITELSKEDPQDDVKRDEYVRLKEKQREDLLNDRKKSIDHRAAVSFQIGEKNFKQRAEKEKRTLLFQDLLIEEKKVQQEHKDRIEYERLEREKLFCQMQMEMIKAEKKRMQKLDEENDREIHLESLRRLNEANRKEAEKKEMKRKKRVEAGNAILEAMARKKQDYAEELTIMVKEREESVRQYAEMQRMIEEERIKMLQLHAPHILQYLPPGVLKESDRQHIGIQPKTDTTEKKANER